MRGVRIWLLRYYSQGEQSGNGVVREVTSVRQGMEHSVKSSRRNRSLLPIMLAMTGVAILVLIGMLLLSNFPGEPEGTTNKTGAPPEDVRR